MIHWWEIDTPDSNAPVLVKAVAYYRHSAQDRQENSIPIQQDQVRAWAKQHGVEIIREFCDAGRSALEVAGVNLKNVSNRKPRHLSRETMILWLQNRRSAGQTLMFRDVCLENRDQALAIRREFGSWIAALRAAFEGHPPED